MAHRSSSLLLLILTLAFVIGSVFAATHSATAEAPHADAPEDSPIGNDDSGATSPDVVVEGPVGSSVPGVDSSTGNVAGTISSPTGSPSAKPSSASTVTVSAVAGLSAAVAAVFY